MALISWDVAVQPQVYTPGAQKLVIYQDLTSSGFIEHCTPPIAESINPSTKG